jgi:hypothetical protein
LPQLLPFSSPPPRSSLFAFLVASPKNISFAFLVVTPEGDLLLSLSFYPVSAIIDILCHPDRSVAEWRDLLFI